jgi:hypothetical protein
VGLEAVKDLGCLGLAILVSACGARRGPPGAVAAVPREGPSREGVTAVRVLTQPELGEANVQAKVEELSPAYALEDNSLPLYPADALAASCPDGAVAIRVTVNTEGRPTLLREVPGRPVPEDACHASFWEATVLALRDWRFIPASREIPRESKDLDGDGKPDYTWTVPEPVTIFVDLEFTFRIVEGHGEVVPR